MIYKIQMTVGFFLLSQYNFTQYLLAKRMTLAFIPFEPGHLWYHFITSFDVLYTICWSSEKVHYTVYVCIFAVAHDQMQTWKKSWLIHCTNCVTVLNIWKEMYSIVSVQTLRDSPNSPCASSIWWPSPCLTLTRVTTMYQTSWQRSK